MTSRSVYPAAVLLIIAAGFALRLHNLAAVPLRGDEAFTALNWAGQPLAEALARTATIEPHPVLTYALFGLWGALAGIGEFAVRALPALTNLLGIPALYALGRRLAGRPAGLLAALLWALHPFQVWHAQDARNYAIWAGVSAVALWLGYRALTANRRADWFLYAFAALLAANIFYFEWFTLAAPVVFTLLQFRRDRQRILRLLMAQSPAYLTSIGSFLILQGSLIASGGYSGTTASRLDIPRLFLWFLPTLSFGDTIPPDFAAVLAPIILLVLLAALWLLWRTRSDSALFLGIIALLPVLLLSIAALRLNIFNPRYILSSAPAYTLILASFVTELARRPPVPRLRYVISGGLVALWLLVSIFSLHNYFNDPLYRKSHNWPLLTGYLAENVTADDLVVQLSIDPAFGYYYRAAADDIALPAHPSQPAGDIEQILAAQSGRYGSLWTVGQTFPDWPNVGVVEAWLAAHMQQVQWGSADGLHYSRYRRWQVAPGELDSDTVAILGDIAELDTVRVWHPPDRAGEAFVWLYWRPMSQTAQPLKVFVHLTADPAAPPLSQDDHFPQNGSTGTERWQTDTIYRDVYALPLADVPPGDYLLMVGFYDPNTSERPVEPVMAGRLTVPPDAQASG